MVLEFHDYCRGDTVPIGFTVLPSRILKKCGYNVVLIPHTEFNKNDDKPLNCEQYLDRKLKEIIGE